MATTILSKKKSTYGGPYCFYTVQYSEKARTATTVTLTITVSSQLQYAASYNGYALNGTLTVGGKGFSIPIKGTEMWQGTTVHTVTKDIVVSAAAGTTSLSAAFAVSNPSTTSSVLSTTQCSNITISRYYTAASVSSAGGKIGSTITLTLSGKYPQTATCDLTYKFKNKTGTIAAGTTATSIQWNTAEIKNDLLAQIPSADSAQCSVTCVTKVSGSSIGSKSCTFDLTTDEAPNITSVTVTPVNTIAFLAEKGIYVAGYSKAQVVTVASAGVGASVEKYDVTGLEGGAGSASWTSAQLTGSGTKTIKVKVTDTRKKTAEVSREIQVLGYTKPALSLAVERGEVSGGDWLASQSGSRLKVEINASVSLADKDNKAALSLTVDGQACAGGTVLTDGQNWEYIVDGEFSTEETHQVTAYITDYLGERSTEAEFIVPTEIVNMSMLAANKGVTLGGHPMEEGFVCNFPAKLYGGIYIDKEKGGFTSQFVAKYESENGVIPLGRLLLDFAHPVGSYYWSSDSISPADMFGGTWTQITGKFVLAAGGGYSAGSTGGAATVTLTTAQMPSHTHTITATAASNGSHSHSMGVDRDAYYITSGVRGYSVHSKGVSGAETTIATGSAGAHAHTITATAKATGGGSAHRNMTPYIAAYCWRRTA